VGEFHTDIDHDRLGHAAASAILTRFQELDEVLGIMNLAPPAADKDAPIDAKEAGIKAIVDERLKEREEARKRQDWQAADQIRHDLAAQGIEIIDTPAGPRWRRKG
jgi:cysteinyl-tRNA synthetase